MSGACRGLLVFTNSLSLLSSIPILILAYLIYNGEHTKCNSFFNGPVAVIGFVLLVVSLLGMIGAGCRVSFMLWLYEWVLFVCILILLCFTVVVSIEMNKSSYEGSQQQRSDTFQLQQFSDYLQLNFVDKEVWGSFKSCFSETRFCQSMGDSVQVKGCCKPPPSCGYESKNGTWEVPQSGLSSNDHDCTSWSNDPNIMCYDCNTCKAGYLAWFKDHWRKLRAFLTCLIVFLVVNFVIGCCAF